MGTANNNLEDLLEGVSGSGPPSVGSVESHSEGRLLLKGFHRTWLACACASMSVRSGVYVHIYVSYMFPIVCPVLRIVKKRNCKHPTTRLMSNRIKYNRGHTVSFCSASIPFHFEQIGFEN